MSGSCYTRAPVVNHQSPHLLSAFPDVNYSDPRFWALPRWGWRWEQTLK